MLRAGRALFSGARTSDTVSRFGSEGCLGAEVARVEHRSTGRGNDWPRKLDMPKQKTNKAALKRLRPTARGKFKRKRAGSSHLNSHMSGKRVRRLRQSAVVPKCEEKRLRKMLCLRVCH